MDRQANQLDIADQIAFQERYKTLLYTLSGEDVFSPNMTAFLSGEVKAALHSFFIDGMRYGMQKTKEQ